MTDGPAEWLSKKEMELCVLTSQCNLTKMNGKLISNCGFETPTIKTQTASNQNEMQGLFPGTIRHLNPSINWAMANIWQKVHPTGSSRCICGVRRSMKLACTAAMHSCGATTAKILNYNPLSLQHWSKSFPYHLSVLFMTLPLFFKSFSLSLIFEWHTCTVLVLLLYTPDVSTAWSW